MRPVLREGPSPAPGPLRGPLPGARGLVSVQTLPTGSLFRRFPCAWRSYFTLEDDTYSLGYPPEAATHPVFASNYCYLHKPGDYVADEKHKQPSKRGAVAQVNAAAQAAFAAPRCGVSSCPGQCSPSPPRGPAPAQAALGIGSEIKALCWRQQLFKKIIFLKSKMQ